jgi:hypothetical protein
VAGQGWIDGDRLGILAPLLELLGDVAGQAVLGTGCGEGYLARVLAGCGARVTGPNFTPNLIARARERTPDGSIAYAVADLSETLPAYDGGSTRSRATWLLSRRTGLARELPTDATDDG